MWFRLTIPEKDMIYASENSDSINAQLNPMTLAFSEEDLENRYQKYYFEGFLTQFRVGTILAASLYLTFYILDTKIIPSVCDLSLGIRVFITLYCAIIFLMSFHSYFERYAQIIISTLSLFGNFGIVIMIALSGDPYSHTYYSGLVLAILCSVLVLRIRFTTSMFIAITVFLGYELVSYSKQYDLEIYFANNFFLVTGIILSLFTSYFFERYDRKIFIKEILEARLREREQTIETIFDLIHSGPLQTLSNVIRHARHSEKLENFQLSQLLKLNQEIRDLNNLLTKEVVDTNESFYLGNQDKLDLRLPLDEILYEVYRKTLERNFTIYQTLQLRIPCFEKPDMIFSFSKEDKKDLCLFLEEALCNVGKHATGATKLEVKAVKEKDQYVIQVIDNGPGIQSDRVGRGTKILQQIAQRLRGQFRRLSLHPKGMMCELRIPLYHD